MPFPSKYYCDQTQEISTFSNDPSGELVVERIPQGLDFFLQPSITLKQDKRKTIIINDWSIINRTHDDFYVPNYRRLIQLRAHVRSLLIDGFLVFQVDENTLNNILSPDDIPFTNEF